MIGIDENHEWFARPMSPSPVREMGRVIIFTEGSGSGDPKLVKVDVNTNFRGLLEEIAVLYSPIKSMFC